MLLLTSLKTTMPKTQYSTVCIIQLTWVSTKTFTEHSHLCALMILLWLSIATCSNQCSIQMDAAMLVIVDYINQSRLQHQHYCCHQQQSHTKSSLITCLQWLTWMPELECSSNSLIRLQKDTVPCTYKLTTTSITDSSPNPTLFDAIKIWNTFVLQYSQSAKCLVVNDHTKLFCHN